MKYLETDLSTVNVKKKKRQRVPKLVFNRSQCVPRAMFIAHTQTSASKLDIHTKWFGQTDSYLPDAMHLTDVLTSHQTSGGAQIDSQLRGAKLGDFFSAPWQCRWDDLL